MAELLRGLMYGDDGVDKIKMFKSDPNPILTRKYENWGQEQFEEALILFGYFSTFEPFNPLFIQVAKITTGYVKYCCDNNIPISFPSSDGESEEEIKQKLLDLHNDLQE